MEQLYLVDAEDRVVGSVARDRAHAEGLLHRSGMVFLSRADGSVLLQHRSPAKRTFPDRYDASCAFHVAYGESYAEAAGRELVEEVGLSAPLLQVAKFVHHDPPEHQVVAVFVGRSDDPVRIDPAESTGGEFLSGEGVDGIVREGRITPWLRDGWPLARGRL
ncbi:MAG: NUDIX hydrolase [Thermoplasmata archaeon]